MRTDQALPENPGEYIASDDDGLHRELFTNGKLSGEGQYKNGKRHGKWKFFYRNGVLKAAGEYLEGELDGITANPINLLLSIIILFIIFVFVGAIMVDQYPCWVGVPNCD